MLLSNLDLLLKDYIAWQEIVNIENEKYDYLCNTGFMLFLLPLYKSHPRMCIIMILLLVNRVLARVANEITVAHAIWWQGL